MNDDEGSDLYTLDMTTFVWNIAKANGSFMPESRDEHTAVKDGNKMYIFGGFELGIRMNSTISFDFSTHEWADHPATGELPPPRAGHSACIHEGKMYIFGGKDEDNSKMKDFWSFDIEKGTWEKLECNMQSIVSRSGHSAVVHGDNMIIFAGIHEITKELDDMACYNFTTKQWTHMFKTVGDRQ